MSVCSFSSASFYSSFDQDIIGGARWGRPSFLLLTAVFAIGFRGIKEACLCVQWPTRSGAMLRRPPPGTATGHSPGIADHSPNIA
jgi:hypothetical protein